MANNIKKSEVQREISPLAQLKGLSTLLLVFMPNRLATLPGKQVRLINSYHKNVLRVISRL